MGVLETLLETLSGMQGEIENLNLKVDSLQVKQVSDQVLKREDLEEILGFKYANVKERR